MRRLSFLLVLTLLFTGCASRERYQLPDIEPPPTWKGESGTKPVPGTLKIHSGELKEDGTILEQEVKFKRSGVIMQTIKVPLYLGGDLVIPEGTKVFAIDYKFSRTTKPGGTTDPIEWFAVLPKGLKGTGSSPRTVYMFWQNPGTVIYNKWDLNTNTPYEPQMFNPSGERGPVPVIEEKTVEFDSPLIHSLRIKEIDQEGIRLENVLSDGGESPAVTPLGLKPWGPGNRVTLRVSDNTITIVPAANFKSVSVSVSESTEGK